MFASILLDILSFFVVIVNTLRSFIVCLHWLHFNYEGHWYLHINFVASHIIESMLVIVFQFILLAVPTVIHACSSANNDNFTYPLNFHIVKWFLLINHIRWCLQNKVSHSEDTGCPSLVPDFNENALEFPHLGLRMEIIYHVKKKLFDLWLPRGGGMGRDGLGLAYANYYIHSG